MALHKVNGIFRWKMIARVLLWIVGVVFLAVAVSLVVVYNRQEWIKEQVLAAVNDRQSGDMQMGSMTVALFSHWPQVAIEVDSLNYFERRHAERTAGDRPIFYADHFFVAFSAWKLIRQSILEVTDAGIENGNMYLKQNRDGTLNLTKAFEGTGEGEGKSLTFRLELVTAKNMLITFRAPDNRMSVAVVRQLEASMNDEGQNLSCGVHVVTDLKAFYLKDKFISNFGTVDAHADFIYDRTTSMFTLNAGNLRLNQFIMAIRGSYQPRDDGALDVSFDGSSNNFVILSRLIKDDVIKMNQAMLGQGHIYLRGRLFGKLKTGKPQIDLDGGATGITLKLPDQLGEFRDIGFTGTFRSGMEDDWSQATLEIKGLKGKVPGGSVSGELRIQNFVKPSIRYRLSAAASLRGYDRIFKLGWLKELRGRISIESNFNGVLDLAVPKPYPGKAEVILDGISFTDLKSKKKISNLSGRILAENQQLYVDSLRFSYDGSRIQLDGQVSHPFHLLFRHESPIEAKLRIHASEFLTASIIRDTLQQAQVQDKAHQVDISLEMGTTVSKLLFARGIPDFSFRIVNLSANFGKLANIRSLTASGNIGQDQKGFALELEDLNALMAQGSVAVAGKMRIPKKNLIEFESHLAIRQLPIEFLQQLIAELGSGYKGPDLKNLPAGQLKLLTTDLNVSATIVPRPFAVQYVDLRSVSTDYSLPNSSHWKAGNVTLHADSIGFKRRGNQISGLKSLSGRLNVEGLELPGIETSSLKLNAEAVDNGRDHGTALSMNEFTVKTSHGTMQMHGDWSMGSMDSMSIKGHWDFDHFSMSQVNGLLAPFQYGSKGAPNVKPGTTEIIKAVMDESAVLTFRPFAVPELQIYKGDASLKVGEASWQTGNFASHLQDIRFLQSGTDSQGTRMESVSGSITFDSLSLPKIGRTPVTMALDGKEGKISIKLKTHAFGSRREEGEVGIDFNKQPVSYRLHYTMEKTPSAEIAEAVLGKKFMAGFLALDVNVGGAGLNTTSIDGTVSLSGDSVALLGVDLDKILEDYEKTQNFTFTDVGAFLVAGPAGPAVTKSNDFARLLATKLKPTDRTQLTQLLVSLKLSKGIISTSDVAFATTKNRVAFNGTVDFARDSIPGLTVAVVDKKGCSLMDQRVYGKVSHIKHDKVNVMGTLFGSVTNAVSAVVPGNCKPFYQGTVKHPK